MATLQQEHDDDQSISQSMMMMKMSWDKWES